MSEQRRPGNLPDYSDSYGNLFKRGRTDALKRVLCEKVQEALAAPDAMTAESILRIVDKVVDVREQADGVNVKWTIHDDLFKLCTNDGSRSLCAGCQTARCCHYSVIELSSDDIGRLSKHLDLSVDDFFKQHCKRIVLANSGLVYTFKKTDPCQFLGEGNYCRVYEARPDVCKRWPLIIATERQKVTNVRILYFCNVLFNLLKYEVTLRVLAGIMQRRTAASHIDGPR